MNFKQELREMQKHRELYFPAMNRLLGLKNDDPGGRKDITLGGDMMILLELLDIGYLNPEAFYIKRTFGEINNLYYLGGYPFTESGEAYFHLNLMKRRRRIYGPLLALLLAAAVLVYYLFM